MARRIVMLLLVSIVAIHLPVLVVAPGANLKFYEDTQCTLDKHMLGIAFNTAGSMGPPSDLSICTKGTLNRDKGMQGHRGPGNDPGSIKFTCAGATAKAEVFNGEACSGAANLTATFNMTEFAKLRSYPQPAGTRWCAIFASETPDITSMSPNEIPPTLFKNLCVATSTTENAEKQPPEENEENAEMAYENRTQSIAAEGGGDGNRMGVIVAVSVVIVVLGLCVIGLVIAHFRSLRKTHDTEVVSSVGKGHAVVEETPTNGNSQNVVVVVGTPLPQEGNAMCAV